MRIVARFKRCSDESGANASGERYFATLRELYAAPQIDGQSLKELWGEADDFYCPNFEPRDREICVAQANARINLTK